MSNSYTTVDIWHFASTYLQDQKETIDLASFNYFMGAIRARDVMKILSFALDPLVHSIEMYRTCSQIVAFFSKNEDFSDDTTCTLNAKRRFYEAEMLCKITNKRLKFYKKYPERDPFLSEKTKMMQEIANLLGSSTHFLDSIPSRIRVTSGATEDSPRSKSLPFLKMRKNVSCTPGSIPFVSALAKYHGTNVRVRTVEANKIVLVPKNAKTHRTIAAEPHGSLPFQLAADSYIKGRLLHWGIDLSSQHRNQELARLGSISGDYATIDLSMASDTLSLEVIRTLFPRKWAEIFSRLRSPCYKGIFGVGEYQKFSSMGNGYTFTLETAVFTAALRALGISDYAVYGDDIIVPTEFSGDVIRLLRHLGFRTNIDKTFVEGPFRESCGADFYNGVAVRPFFVKRYKNLSKTDLCHFINGMYRIGKYDGGLWRKCLALTRSNSLIYTPYTENTRSGIHIDWQTARSLGLLKDIGWVQYAPVYQDVQTFAKLRGIEGLKVFLYKQAFEDHKCGWEIKFHQNGTRIVRYVEPSPQTNGALLAIRVKKVRQVVVEKRTYLFVHYCSLSEWIYDQE